MTTATDSPPAFLYAPDFFRTNRIFTDGDQKLVQQHLDYAEANLLDVQKLMLDVQVDEDHIQDLTRQERELVDCIERCRVALAPIKKLPDDVLRCIFIICCKSPTNFLSSNSKPILITLCEVCSAWRGLALETPFLWSQISLFQDWSFFHAHDLSYVEDAVKLWFARASTCHISLWADYGSLSTAAQERELIDLVGRVIALPSRYRKIALDFSCQEIDILLGKLSPDHLCHLEELETMDADKFVVTESLNPLFPPATTFANLKALTITGYWNSNNLRSLLPFPRLQRLIIRTTMSLALELFRQCPLLELCDIGIERSDSTIRSRPTDNSSYITLPQLRDVSMEFESTEDCCRFIDQLVLRNLQSLVLVASHETVSQHNEMAEHIIALSQRSGTPNIRVLYLDRKLIPILNPGTLLRSLPHLEKFDTDGSIALDEETLDGLAMGTISPCLINLHADDIEAKLATLTRMAKQRARNVGLNKLRVTTRKSVLSESGWGDLSPSCQNGP